MVLQAHLERLVDFQDVVSSLLGCIYHASVLFAKRVHVLVAIREVRVRHVFHALAVDIKSGLLLAHCTTKYGLLHVVLLAKSFLVLGFFIDLLTEVSLRVHHERQLSLAKSRRANW